MTMITKSKTMAEDDSVLSALLGAVLRAGGCVAAVSESSNVA